MANKKKKAAVANTAKVNVTVPTQNNNLSGDFITVKSKLPISLSHVLPNGKVIVIKGTNMGDIVKMGADANLYNTTLLSKDEWEHFVKVNHKQPYMVKRIIFADVKASNADAIAKELAKDSSTKTGFEQQDPNAMPDIKSAESQDARSGVGVTI